MSTIEKITTAPQLLDAPDLGRCELVRGELIMMSPAGFEHGYIAAYIGSKLLAFVKERNQGVVTAAETGFWIRRDPDTVRAPDVGFVRADRVPPGALGGFFPGAPDLAVEVLSPNDRAGEVLDKVQDWLDAGCQAVWVVNPAKKTVSVYRPGAAVERLIATDTLADENLLPGFALPLAEVFA
jgi:Uma2 family endonuclease